MLFLLLQDFQTCGGRLNSELLQCCKALDAPSPKFSLSSSLNLAPSLVYREIWFSAVPEGAAQITIIIIIIISPAEETHSSWGVFLSVRSAGLITVKLTQISSGGRIRHAWQVFCGRSGSFPALVSDSDWTNESRSAFEWTSPKHFTTKSQETTYTFTHREKEKCKLLISPRIKWLI